MGKRRESIREKRCGIRVVKTVKSRGKRKKAGTKEAFTKNLYKRKKEKTKCPLERSKKRAGHKGGTSARADVKAGGKGEP